MKQFYCLFISVLVSIFILPLAAYGTHSINPFPNKIFCSSSFPTPYLNTALFTLDEGVNTDFNTNQTNRTIILTLPAGFEFNTAAGPTVTSSGTGISAISFTWTVSTITVTLSTNGLSRRDAIQFNNFLVRATAPGQGELLRNGGTFTVEGSTGTPSLLKSFGHLETQPPMVYDSSTVVQYTTTDISRSCTSSSNPILEIQVNVSGSTLCSSNIITQFNFNTAGDPGSSQNPSTNISKAKVYYSGQTQGFSYANFFGAANSPNGAFTINGSQALTLGTGTYYFYLTYDIPSTANLDDLVDASITSFVIDGSVETDMASLNPMGTRKIVTGGCGRAPDLPNPAANLQTVTAGSLVIPMDNSHQNLWSNYPFNIKAYGLVNALLQNDIPVKWVIKSGKVKDGIDFSAVASRVYPTTAAAATQDFRAGAYIIDPAWLNAPYYPGGQTATQVISAFATRWKVAVYRLAADVAVDVRYTLNQRLKIAVFSNGGYESLQQKILDSAKIPNYVVIDAGDFTGLADCYTFCSEAHWDYSDNPDTIPVKRVRDFVNQGGNFLAQCAGIDLYENHQQPTHFLSTNGINGYNATITNTYYNVDMAYNQFEGTVASRTGTISFWERAASSLYKPEMYYGISTPLPTDTVVAGAAHLSAPDSVGSNVFYLGGHDYATGQFSTLSYINGTRMYLNAALVPANRPTAFSINAGVNSIICSGQSTTLGGTPTGPSGATYIWSPTTGLDDYTAANPVASPTVTTTYTLMAMHGNCTAGPAYVTVTVKPLPAVTSAQTGTTCSASAQNYAITSDISGATYTWSRASVAGISNAAVTGQSANPITETLINTTTSPIDVRYTITPGANGCVGPAFTYTVTVKPATVITSGSSATICSAVSQNYTITSTISGTTYSWSRAAIAGISNSAVTGQLTSSITEALVNTTTSAIDVPYTIVPSANGCAGPAFVYTIAVKPTPAVTSAATATRCSGVAQNYVITSGVAGATYTWSRAAVAGISNSGVSAQSGSTITETLINTTAVAAAVTYVITPTANGCAGPAFNYVVTVSPTPIINSASAGTICSGTAQNYSMASGVSGTTYTWSRAAVAGISNASVAAQSSGTITEALTNTTTAAINVTYVIVPSASGCPGPAFNYVVTVNPKPLITSASSATLCSGTAQNYAITSGVSGTTYTWSRAAVAGISNAAVTAQNGGTITETLTNTTTAPIAVSYIITPSANGCDGPAFNYVVTVNPTPAVTSVSSGIICSGVAQNYIMTSGVSGTTYKWSRATVAGISNAPVTGQNSGTITEALVNTTTSAIDVTYVIIPRANGCDGPAFNYVVTVNATPLVTSASAATLCSGVAQNYIITSGVSGTTYTWSRAAVSGINNAAASGQHSGTIAEALVNTTASPIVVSYLITPSANGCDGPTFNYVVTVNPTPAVTSPSSNTVCSGVTQNYTMTSNVSGASYSWSRAAVAGISNVAVTAQGSGTITEALVNTTNVAIDVSYVIIPSANGCDGPAFNYVVRVSPTPTVTSASSASLCSGAAQNYTIISSVGGTTYSWSRAAVAGISNSAVTAQSSGTITEALINTTTSAIGVSYKITPSANGCDGPVFTYALTVNPKPVVTSASFDTLCSGAAQHYIITSGVSGTTFTWSRAGVAGITNAAVAAQSSSSITETLINTTTSAIDVSYVIVPSANGCDGPAFNYVVTVRPTPVVTSASSDTLCSGVAQNYVITGGVIGATYTWSRAAVAGISNAAVTAQSSATISEGLINTSTSAIDVTYVIIPSASGCDGPAFNYIVTVNPTPLVTSASTATVCSGEAQNYTMTSGVSGTTYTWSRAAVAGISNAPLTAQPAGTITEALINTTISAIAVSYIIIPSANGCDGPAFNYVVTINPTPIITSASADTLCSGVAQNYVISSGVSGTTYTWSRAAVAGISNASVSAQNSASITETLVNTTTSAIDVSYVIIPSANGCTGPTFNYVVTVNPTPIVTSAYSDTLCSGEAQNYTITSGVSNTSYTWSRAAVSGISNVAVSSQSTGTITEALINTTTTAIDVTYVIIPSASGCNGPAFNYVITVDPTPVVTSISADTICSGVAQSYTITSGVSGTSFTWSRSSAIGISNAAVTGQGSGTITEALINTTTAAIDVTYVIIPSAHGCDGPAFNYVVTVNPTPNVTSASADTLCSAVAQNYIITSGVSGAGFIWSRAAVPGISNTAVDNQTSSTITEALINITTLPIDVTYVIIPSASGCNGPAFNYVVTINPAPIVTSASSDTVCSDEAQNYTMTSGVSGTTYTWSRAAVAGISNAPLTGQRAGTITEALINTTTSDVDVSYIIIPSANGCDGPAFNYVVTVSPTPIITSVSVDTLCSGVAQNYVMSSSVSGTTYSWSRAAVAGISNASVSAQNSSFITETLVNTTTSAIDVSYLIIPSANGCNGPGFNYVVTVNPTPIVTSASSDTLCSGVAQNYTITSGVSSATYTWSRVAITGISNAAVSAQSTATITEALINTTNSAIDVTYVIIPSASGCNGPAFNYVVTVNPTPVVTSSSTDTLCSGEAQNYRITSGVNGTGYTWSRAAIAGISNAAVAAQTTGTITEALINTTTAAIDVTYIITPSASGCNGPAFNYVVTVSPTPGVTSASTDTLCSGVAQNYTITSGVTGTTFTWSRAAVTGISNLPVTAQSSGVITEALVNTTSSAIDVSYTITPSANGCDGPVFTYVLTVNPTPLVTSVSSDTVCSGLPQHYNIMAGVSGTTFTWSRAAIDGITNAAVSAQSSNGITEALINTTTSAIDVTYIIKPSANGCDGPAFNYIVTVNPTPLVTSASSATVCSGVAQLYVITSGVSGATYTWSRTAVAGISNASVTDQKTGTITEALINTTTSAIDVSYIIVPSANGCEGPAYTYVVSVNPTPVVTSASSDTLCSGVVQNYNITASVSGSTFTWSRAAVTGITNPSVTAQSSGSITETLINTTTSAIDVSYLIIPTANGCGGPAFTYVVTVSPTPTVTSRSYDTVCSGAALNYTITSGVPGTTYSWSRAAVAGISNAAVTGQANGSITEALINTTSSAVDVTYIITPSASGCNGPAFNYVVTVNPTPVVTSVSVDTLCSSVAQNYIITSGVSGATFTWSRAAVAGISNSPVTAQHGGSITEALINTTTAPIDVSYIIVPSASGCDGPSFNYVVTVNPTPVVTSASTDTLCSGAAQNYAIFSGVSGATFTWSRAAVAGVTNASVSGQSTGTISEALINTTTTAVNVTYVIIPSASGCDGPAFNYVVRVNPTPIVSSSATGTVCSEVAQNYIITSGVSGTTYTWSRGAVTGISNAAVTNQPGGSITEALINTTTSPIDVSYVIIPSANGCDGPAFNYVVTVNPKPLVTSAPADTLCSGAAQNYAITSGVAGTTFTWSRAGITGISNAPVTAQSSGSITEALINTTTAAIDVSYTIIPLANGCAGPAFDYVVTVNPTPLVTSASSDTLCSSVAHNYIITSGVAGATYTWSRAAINGISNAPVTNQATGSISETLINTSTSPFDVTYIIIPRANGCDGPAFNYVVTVFPSPAVTSASTDTVCSGVTQHYIITSSVTGTTYTWRRAAVAGISNAPAPAQNSGTITEALINTTTSPIDVSYLIIPSANGCDGPAFNYVVTVNPTPLVTSAPSDTLCSGAAQNYDIMGGVSGTTYSWSRAAVAGVSNAAVTDQRTGTITEVLLNITSVPVDVSYVIIPTANGCDGPAFNYVVTVNPTPTVTSASSDTICSGAAQNYLITSGVSGTTYSWSRPAVAGIGNAPVAGRNSNAITETLLNTTTSAIDVTYVIIPSANGCEGPSFNYVVTVSPTPAVTSVSSDTICSGEAQHYTITSSVNGTNFTWSRATVPGISNAFETAHGGTITEALINTTTAAIDVTYVIIPSASGCDGPAFNYVATVNPTPIVTSASSNTLCSGAPQNYVITSGVSGATYTWSRAAVSGISNTPVTAQSSGTISEALINTTTAPIDVSYLIIPSANGCDGPAFNYLVKVNPTPIVTSNPVDTICSGAAQNYVMSSGVSGATYSWSRAAVAGISNTAAVNQTSNTITETLINTTTSAIDVTYIIIPSANGCQGPAFNYVVTVNPRPTVTSASSDTLCSGVAQNYTITSGVSGTTYTWSRAVITGISNTAIAGQQANSINETLINTTTSPIDVAYVIIPSASGCNGPSFNYVVTVNPTPVVTSPLIDTLCSGMVQNYTITSSVSGTTYTWSRATVAGISNATVAAHGSGTITETLINTTTSPIDVSYVIVPSANGCDGPAFNYTVTINPTPVVTSASTDTLCSGAVQNYIVTSGVSGTTYTWSRPAVAGISNAGVQAQTSGTITEALINTTTSAIDVSYIIIPSANGCDGAAFNYVVTVNPTPIVTSTLSDTLCSGEAQHYTITSAVTGTTYAWSRAAVTGISNAATTQNSSTITEALVSTTSSAIDVTYVIIPSANGCVGPAFKYVLTVSPTPIVTSGSIDTVCSGEAQHYAITSGVIGTTYTWSRAAVAGISNASATTRSSTINEALVNTTTSSIDVNYVIIPSASGCNGLAFDYVVTVNPTPVVTSASSDTLCSGAANSYAITSGVNGATYTWSRATVAGISNVSVTGQRSSTITEALTNTTTAAIDVTYVIVPSANGCDGPSFVYVVRVNPTPAVTSNSADTLCSGAAQHYNITSGVSGATFTWSRLEVTGISNAALTAQRGNIITEALVNSTTSAIDVTYVIVPSANGCSGPAFNYVVTVNPTPKVSGDSINTICNDVAQNYTITSGVGGTTYTWSRAAIAGISNAAIAGQHTNPITETLVNTTSSAIDVRYIIIPSANGCDGPAFNYVVKVNPTPTVTSASSATLCSGVAQNYIITSGVSDATYTWSRAAVSGISNTAVGNQNSNTIAETLINTTSSPIDVSYIIIPSANGCDGPAFKYVVTIHPTPTVTSAASNTLCSGVAQHYTIASGVSGTSYTWSRAVVSGISNAAVTAGSNIITEALVNTTTSAIDVTYVIIPSASGCDGVPFNYIVTVNPTPAIISASTDTLCSGQAQNYTIISGVSGATYTWSRTPVAGISNASVTGQRSGSITEALINTTNSPIDVSYIIVPSANGCDGPAFNYTVTINPTPIVTSASSDIRCSGVTGNHTITSSVSGTSYIWSRAAVTGISNASVTAQSSGAITEALINTTTAPIDVSYIIIPSANGCSGPAFNYVVTVNPTPIVTSASSQTLCSGVAQNYKITSEVTGTTYTWSRAAITGITNGSVTAQSSALITEALVNTTTSAIDVTYTIIPSARGCEGPAFNYIVTVMPTPTVTSASAGTLCSGDAQSYTITSGVSGAGFSWSRSAVAGISNAAVTAQPSTTITEALINTTTAPVDVTYTVTPSANGCNGPSFNYVVTVNPTPIVTSASSNTLCSGLPQQYTITSNVSGTTYMWTRVAVSGISNAPLSDQHSSLITESLINTTTGVVNVTYVITPNANGCNGPVFNYVVSVNPTPTITSSSSNTLCSGVAQHYNITSGVSGTTYTWSRAAVMGISNAAVTAQQSGTIAEALVNTTTAAIDVTYVIVPSAAGCTGPAFNYVVTVNPTPIVTSASTNTICSGAAQQYSIASGVAGTTYTWSRAAVNGISNTPVRDQASGTISETLINTTASDVDVSYIIVPSANGCQGPAFNYVVTVRPTPVVTSSSSNTICSGVMQNYTITSGVSGTTYTWSRAAIPGIGNAAIGAQHTNRIAETLINTTTSAIDVSYIIVPSANGCDGPAFTYVVTANPTPAVSSASSETVCSGQAQQYQITSGVSGATFTWSRGAVAGIRNTAVDNQTSSTITEALVNTTTSSIQVRYTITPSANGCAGPVFDYVVTVKPTPVVTSVSKDTLCTGVAQHYTVTSAVSSTTFTWSRAAVTGISNPSVTGQRSGVIAEALINTTPIAVDVTYIIIPSANGCEGPAFNYMVTVNPTPPTPFAGNNSPVCYGSTVNLTASTVERATYTWTGPNNFSSVLQNPTIANVTTAASGIYSVTATVNGCPGIAANTSVTVNTIPPAPIPGSNGPLCAGADLILTASAFTGASYSWTGPNGFTSTLRTPVINRVSSQHAGDYFVTATINGCTSVPAKLNVIVNPPPVPTAGSNDPVCSGQVLNLTASSIPTAVYSWKGPDGFSSSIQNPDINNVSMAASGTYSVIATVPGCAPSSEVTTIVLVKATPPAPAAASNSPICTGSSINLATPAVSGATYNWKGPNGFTSSVQNPIITNATLASAGTYSVTITIDGCPSKAGTTEVVMKATPSSAVASNNGPLCTGSTLRLIAADVAGASYIWYGPSEFNAITQNPVIDNVTFANAGTYTVLAVVDGCTSAAADTKVIVSNQPSFASAGSNQTVCANNAIVKLAGTITGGSSTGIWSSNGTGNFFPSNTSLNATYIPSNADTAAGSVTLTLRSSNNGVCAVSMSSFVVTITDAPKVSAGEDQSVCSSADASINLRGQVSTSTGAIWTTSGTGRFSPSNTSLNATYFPSTTDKVKGRAMLTLSSTGNGSCTIVSDTMIITIKPAPNVDAGPDRNVLVNGTTMLEPVVTGTDLQYLWTPKKNLNNNTIKNPLVTGVEDQVYTLTVTGTGGCVNEDQVRVTVLLPFVIPNTFTPNNDGINDRWLIPKLSTYPGCRVQVFNRYGQIVFESIGYTIPWDGTLRGKPLPFGTYYYVIEPFNGLKPITGYVTIIK